MPEGLREALESAFEQSSESTEIPSSAPPTEPDASTPEGGTPPEPTATPTTEPLTEEQQRARDALGRFTKADQPDGKGQVPAAPGKPAVSLVGQPPVQNTPKFEPPPRGVPPTLRSHWTGLTPEWRQHITETHGKLAEVEQQYQPATQFTQSFLQAVQPFQHAIQAETGGVSGQHMITAVRGLMDTATKLRFGTPVEKAQTAAAIVKAYGIDINALDEALVGVTPTQPAGVDPSMVQNAVQQALAPLMQQVQQRRQATQQEVATQVETEISAFAADTKNEFFEDVRDIMADLMEVAERQNKPLTLADAYTRACWLHPEVNKVMLARQQGQSAQSLTQAAQRAKAAAVSVKGAAPVGNPAPTEPASVREAIENAIEVHSRV